MILIVYFTDKNRPEEYINNAIGNITPKKGDTFKTQNDYGVVTNAGFENRGGTLMKFIEVKIDKEEPWVELKGTPTKTDVPDFAEGNKKNKKVKHNPEYIRKHDDLWYIPPSKEMSENINRLQEKIDSQPDYSNELMPETPNFHTEYQTNEQQ